MMICFLALAAAACTARRGNEEDLVNMAENQMDKAPEKALQLCNRVGETKTKLSKEYYMKYLLVRTEALNKTFAALDTIDYMPKVLEYYRKHGTAEERARAYYMMGSIYRDRRNSPQALIYFRDAVSQAKGHDVNPALLSRIYTQMALLFHQQRFPQKEADIWKKVSEYALEAKDTLMTLEAYYRMSSVYWQLGKKDSAMIMIKDIIKEYKRLGWTGRAAGIQCTPMLYYLERDSLAEAKLAIDEYISESGLVDEELRPTERNEIFYLFIGMYYEKTGQMDSALFFYRRLLEYDDDIQNLENGYHGLMSAYLKLGMADSVCKYAVCYADANDTANARNSATEISRTQALYDFGESQSLALRKSQEVVHLWRSIYLILALVALAGAALYVTLSRKRRREREEMLETNRKYVAALDMYNKATEEMAELKEDVNELLKRKKQETERLMRELAMYQETSNPEDWDSVERAIQQQTVVRQMHMDASECVVASETEWRNLAAVVNNYLPSFYSAIRDKKYKLSSREQQVCILTRLHFITSEISILMGISKQRISNIHSNINQKLFNEEDTHNFRKNIHTL